MRVFIRLGIDVSGGRRLHVYLPLAFLQQRLRLRLGSRDAQSAHNRAQSHTRMRAQFSRFHIGRALFQLEQVARGRYGEVRRALVSKRARGREGGRKR